MLGPSVFERNLPAPPQGGRSFHLYRGAMFAHEKATATWNRVVAYNGSGYPSIVRALSDLNLFGYRTDTDQLVGQSASAIDNVEQFSAPADGGVVLKVAAGGPFDPAVSLQRDALSVPPGFVAADGPNFTAAFANELGVTWSEPFRVWVTLQNVGDLPAHGVAATISGYDVVRGSATRTVGLVEPAQRRQVEWLVRRRLAVGNDPVRVTVDSVSYGESRRWALRERP